MAIQFLNSYKLQSRSKFCPFFAVVGCGEAEKITNHGGSFSQGWSTLVEFLCSVKVRTNDVIKPLTLTLLYELRALACLLLGSVFLPLPWKNIF